MLHHRTWVMGLAAVLAALVLAPAAPAAGSSKAPSGSQAKERAYGKHCGPKVKRRALTRTRARAKCLDAMAKLDSGTSTSPRKACRGLSSKRARGERKSAFARCVLAGAGLMKANRRAGGTSGPQDDDDADDLGPGADAVDPGDDDDDDRDPDLDLGADAIDPDRDDD